MPGVPLKSVGGPRAVWKGECRGLPVLVSQIGPSHSLLPFGSELLPGQLSGFLPKAASPGLKAIGGWPALLDVWRQSRPSPAHPLPLIFLPPSCLASLPLLYGWHMEAISIYPQHQDAASCCATASGILGFPAGPFQRLHAKQPAVCRERLGLLLQR